MDRRECIAGIEAVKQGLDTLPVHFESQPQELIAEKLRENARYLNAMAKTIDGKDI